MLNRDKKLMMWILLAGVLVAAGLVGYRIMQDRGIGLPWGNSSPVVATVNDERITRSELDEKLNQLAAAQQMPLPEKSTEEYRSLEMGMLDQMVAEKLLLEEAERLEITVTEDEVAERYATIAEQFGGAGESFEDLLAAEGFTTERFRVSLRQQMTIEAYINHLKAERGVTVSEEEVRQTYETEFSGQEPEIAFETAEPHIRQQLEQQKVGELLPEIIAGLKEQASVEILI